ncbi:putative reverse transcriptase domain-containing protein [Tanacetum coccineum]
MRVGSPPSRVILFGDIPTVIPFTSVVAPETSTIAPVISSAAPVVETTLVASPTGLCGLIPYSDSDSDSPDEMSWVTVRPLSSFEFPIAPVTASPGIRRQSSILIRPWETIPFGRPYRTYFNGPRKLLIARKRVGPIPARRLASRRVSPYQAYSGSSTRDVSPRLGYPPRRAPRCSEEFCCWCAAPLSTLPSRKRCRSLVDYVPSSTPVMGSLAPTRADLLPPHKRFRDSYSSESSIEEDTKINPIKIEVDMELGIGDRNDVRNHVEIDPRDVRDDTEGYEADTSTGDTVEVGIDLMSVPIIKEEIIDPTREDSSDSSGTRDGIVRSFKDMPIDLDDAIETAQRWLEADQLIARGQRVIMIERIDSLRLENLKVRAMLDIERDRVNSLRLYMSLSREEFRQVRRDCDDTRGRLRSNEELVNRCVEEALAAHEATRTANALETENQSQNGSDGDNGNGGNGNGRDENLDENGIGDRPVARECTYQDFMKCQPLNFKGTEGVLGLIRCALTWWNSYKRTIRTEAVFSMSWRELMKLMTEVYCPRNEIQKMETELNNPGQQPPYKQQNTGGHNVARAYMAGNNEKNGYEGTLPFCNKCKLHHEGQCTAKCHNCKRIIHLARDCRFVVTIPTQGTPGPNQGVVTCFECGMQGYYWKDCPKVKNQNRGNKARVPDVRGKAYVLGGGDANPGANTVTGTFLLNDHRAYMLFDSGANRSFVSNTFSALLDITPYALDVSYAVELADRRT